MSQTMSQDIPGYMLPTQCSRKHAMSLDELEKECARFYGLKIRVKVSSVQTSLSKSRQRAAQPRVTRQPVVRPRTQRNHSDNGKQKSTAALLRELQFREVTPEDYDLLLQLDESVAKKCLTQADLDALPEVTLEALLRVKIHDSSGSEGIVQGSDDGEEESKLCLVCHEDLFQLDAAAECCRVKVLPCGHRFHYDCLSAWLLKTSTQCPYCRAEVAGG